MPLAYNAWLFFLFLFEMLFIIVSSYFTSQFPIEQFTLFLVICNFHLNFEIFYYNVYIIQFLFPLIFKYFLFAFLSDLCGKCVRQSAKNFNEYYYIIFSILFVRKRFCENKKLAQSPIVGGGTKLHLFSLSFTQASRTQYTFSNP